MGFPESGKWRRELPKACNWSVVLKEKEKERRLGLYSLAPPQFVYFVYLRQVWDYRASLRDHGARGLAKAGAVPVGASS